MRRLFHNTAPAYPAAGDNFKRGENLDQVPQNLLPKTDNSLFRKILDDENRLCFLGCLVQFWLHKTLFLWQAVKTLDGRPAL